MLDGKPTIMHELMRRITTHPAGPQVTEDFSKKASLASGGAAFVSTCIVVEREDIILSTGMLNGRATNSRRGYVSVISFIQARSSELGPTDMRNFAASLRAVIYQDETRSIGDTGVIKEKQAGMTIASPQNHKIFAQEIIFGIDYREYATVFGPIPTP